MSVYAVIGLGFGDEGKGLTTDYLCSQLSKPLVVRFSGGHQVGHTVVFQNKTHVFSNFGSGSFRNAPTYWSKFCTIEPIALLNELKVLKSFGLNPLLYIDEECPVTTPYDVAFNRESEKHNNHGSCGVGFGATLARERNHYSFKFRDLFYPQIAAIKLELIQKYYNFKNQYNVEPFVDAIFEIIKTANIIPAIKIPENEYSDLVFEGSQGLLLDQNFGFYPHVTPSNIGTKNIFKLINAEIKLFLVTRAYQTRHGNGLMTNENYAHKIKDNPFETNIQNEFQGSFRKSILDVDLLKYAIQNDYYLRECNNNTLVITCLDHISEEYAFTSSNKICYAANEDDFVRKIASILQIENVILSHSPESNNMKILNLAI